MSSRSQNEEESARESLKESVKEIVEIGCFQKSLTFFLTLFICFVGVIITGCAAIVVIQLNEFDDELSLMVPPAVMICLYCILATGCILTLIGLCGCCGSIFESDTMLKIFFVLVLIVFLVQICGCVVALSMLSTAETEMRNSMKNVYVMWIDPESDYETLLSYSQNIIEPTRKQRRYSLAWLVLQNKFECCGYDSPNDWMKSIGVPAYAAYCTEDPLLDLSKSKSKLRYFGGSNDTHKDEVDDLVNSIKELSRKKTHKNPCRNVFVKFTNIMVAAIIVAFLVEVIVLILAWRLIYNIRRKKCAEGNKKKCPKDKKSTERNTNS